MKKAAKNRGIIKNLIVIIIAFCVIFLVLAALASYVVPGGGRSGGFSSLTTPPDASYYEVKTNPLLDFGTTPDYSSYGYGSYGSYGSYAGNRQTSDNADKGRSPHSGKVTLSTGNIYTIQPHEEYLTLRNSGAAVDITGWVLTNGKGTRPVETSYNSYFYPAADSATIGKGTEFLDPTGRYVTGSIVLKNGDQAYITTGGPFTYFPMPITTSFKDNICTGYLKNYPFQPQLSYNCPYPTNDSQIRTVTDECYDFMRSLQRCEDPTKYTTLYQEERYKNLTSQCRNFMNVRLNYPSCVANNRNTANFLTKDWRIFLGKSKELWASSRETITLYDKNGLIVDQINY